MYNVFLSLFCSGVPFDYERFLIPNVRGAVIGDKQTQLSPLYCSGWVKRGPRGVILSSKLDAEETVDKVSPFCPCYCLYPSSVFF
jgi:NADPH-dependent glutamate synthase beta subunit-like oxidoreductase